jgi:hypothetical protein
MSQLLETARAYLDALEADRQSALALSKEKAEEAKLLQARLEGFRAAIEMLGGHIPEGNAGISDDPPPPAAKGVTQAARKRRSRRNIPELIVRELSFSGEAMTAREIAKGIGYNLEGTETALERLEQAGRLLRDDGGRWAISTTALTHTNGHSRKAGNGKLPAPEA